MCGFDIVGLVRPGLVFNKAASLDLYVQPRSRKIRSKIGIGIPRSQSKIYPVAAASFILFVKRILIIFCEVKGLESVVCAEPPLINDDAQSGRRMIA